MDWSPSPTAWLVIALVLFAAEALAPGAFMLWLGIAAAVVFAIVLAVPGLSLLAQAAIFVLLSFAAALVYRRWFRGRGRRADDSTLNRRAEQLVGRVVPLEHAIVNGIGRVQIADAYWEVHGEDLPAGSAVRIVGVDGMSLRVVAAG